MYKHALLVFALLWVNSTLFAQWEQYKTPRSSIANARIIRKGANTLFAQNHSIYVSYNLGDTWKKVSKAFSDTRSFMIQGNTLWINDGASLYKSQNDGVSWQRITNIPLTGKAQIEGMALGQKDTVFVSLINSAASAFVSYNGGSTWEEKLGTGIFLPPIFDMDGRLHFATERVPM